MVVASIVGAGEVWSGVGTLVVALGGVRSRLPPSKICQGERVRVGVVSTV